MEEDRQLTRRPPIDRKAKLTLQVAYARQVKTRQTKCLNWPRGEEAQTAHPDPRMPFLGGAFGGKH